ncbi:MAG: polymer-forming cytoskeletal protein [Pseudomonadota bacterium]|nr:polymer-forming cytoskeletal protein [Pseudomonadota bacterium]
MFERKPSKRPSIDTLIGVGTRIRGDVEFSGGLHLDGYINGDVTGKPGSEANLWVSESGGIEGAVAVSSIVLNGIVNGDIDAAGRVELGEKARVLGNVRYSVVETAVGAQISGKLIHRANSGGAEGGHESVEGNGDPVGEPRL